MRILDKKGRLFGKINIIDAVIIILLIFIACVYAGLIKKTISIEGAYKRELVVVEIVVRNLPDEIYKLIKVGDKGERPNLGYPSTIEKIEKIETRKIELHNKTIERVELLLLIKIKVFIENGSMIYQYQEVIPGNNVTFQTKDYQVTGFIRRIYREDIR